jgi:FtsH-binding integral membrane protein
MKNVLQKLSIRLILFQCLAVYLFGDAFFRFYYFLNADLYECLFRTNDNNPVDCLENYPDKTVGELMTAPIHYMLYGLLVGIIVISIVNVRKKKPILNTVLVAALFIVLFLIGAFADRYLDSWIYSLGRIFSKKIVISNLIAAQIAFLTALGLVWFSVKNKRNKEEK